MMLPGKPAKVLLIDSNVLFTKRLGDALKREDVTLIQREIELAAGKSFL